LFPSVSRSLLLAVRVPHGGPSSAPIVASVRAFVLACARLSIIARSCLERQRSVGSNRILKTEQRSRTEKKTCFVFFVSTVFSVTPFLRSGCSVPPERCELKISEVQEVGMASRNTRRI